MKYEKLISVVIAAYNEEKFIKKSVKSILNQTYSNIECIVVNDGSTDKTLSKLKEICDPRLKIIDTENNGRVFAKNLALRKSKGKLILFQDADDWSSKDRIRMLFEASQKIGKKAVVGSNYRIFDNFKRTTRDISLLKDHKQIVLKMSRKIMSSAMFPPCLMISRDFLIDTGPWRYKFDIAAEDGDLLDRLYENGAIFHNVQNYLYTYRLNEGSITTKFVKTIPYQMFKRFCKKCRYKNKKEPESFKEYFHSQNKNIFHSLKYKLEFILWYLLFSLVFRK